MIKQRYVRERISALYGNLPTVGSVSLGAAGDNIVVYVQITGKERVKAIPEILDGVPIIQELR